MEKKKILKFVIFIFFIIISLNVFADIEIKADIFNGQKVEIHGGFLGLSIIDTYMGYYTVDQVWMLDKATNNDIVFVTCHNPGVNRCKASYDNKDIILGLPGLIIKDDLFNDIVNSLINKWSDVITNDRLYYSETKTISVPTTEGKNKLVIFRATYNFKKPGNGVVRILVKNEDIK